MMNLLTLVTNVLLASEATELELELVIRLPVEA